MSSAQASVRRPLTTTPNVVLAAGAVFLVTALLYAGSMWPVVLWKLLTDGLLALCWAAAAAGIGAGVLRSLSVRLCSHALQIVVSAATGLGCVSLIMLICGLAGLLHRAVGFGIVAFGLALFAWSVVSEQRWKRPQFEITRWAWLWLVPAGLLGVAAVLALLPPGVLWRDEPHGYDVVEYHLQVPREWCEQGRIVPLRHNVFSYFPFNLEMHYLLAMLLRGGPWAGMYLAHFMHVGFVALAVAAVYGVLAELGSRYATVGAVAAASAPWMLLLAPIAYNEGGLLLFGTLAAGMMLIAARSPNSWRIAAVSGVMAGFACGTKLTAVPMVLFAVPLVAMVLPASRPRGDSRITPIIVFVVSAVITFSPWLVRNLTWTGNPVFPEAASLLGRAHFTEAQVERWERAHAPRPDQAGLGARIRAFSRQVLVDWRFGWVLLPLVVLVALLEWRRRATYFLLLLLISIAVFWLAFTHLQGRFFVLAIPLAGVMIGMIRHSRLAAAMGVVVTVAGCLSPLLIHANLMRDRRMLQMVALEDLSLFTPLGDVPVEPEQRVLLAGDARAFVYNIDMSRLEYRTVFDVDAQPGDSAVDAWTRGMKVVPGQTIVLIDPNELRRFARTYWQIPPLPPELADRGEPILLPR